MRHDHENYLGVPTRGKLTMVKPEPEQQSPSPRRPTVLSKDGLSADDGARGAASSFRPQASMVVVCWGNSPRAFVPPGPSGHQFHSMMGRRSSPLGQKQGFCVSRSSGATTRAVTRHKAKADHQFMSHQRAQGSSHVHLRHRT